MSKLPFYTFKAEPQSFRDVVFRCWEKIFKFREHRSKNCKIFETSLANTKTTLWPCWDNVKKEFHKWFCTGRRGYYYITIPQSCVLETTPHKLYFIYHEWHVVPRVWRNFLYAILYMCYTDHWDILSNKLQRYSWLSERWQQISMCCSLYLTLDQQVVFSAARITGVANLPLRIWSNSKKASASTYLGVKLGSRGMKMMPYHRAIHTSQRRMVISLLIISSRHWVLSHDHVERALGPAIAFVVVILDEPFDVLEPAIVAVEDNVA